VCTVLLRFTPGGRWPVLLGAVRDEFADRRWLPPARHWDGLGLVGGQDLVAGGTWLAAEPATPAVAAVLNGVPLAHGVRTSRGGLPLAALTGQELPDPSGYDGFHLLRATPRAVEVWTWDGLAVRYRALAPGDHILVNAGVDPPDHPLVEHFRPLLRATADPDPRPGLAPAAAWGGWLRLLAGDGLDPTDPRALLVRRVVAGRTYASTSASLLALAPGVLRYDFTAKPGPDAGWYEVQGTSR
jgi:transport and Golgi organization protein 2